MSFGRSECGAELGRLNGQDRRLRILESESGPSIFERASARRPTTTGLTQPCWPCKASRKLGWTQAFLGTFDDFGRKLK
jgi:hypothetical protein